jgi:hypothetical protein
MRFPTVTIRADLQHANAVGADGLMPLSGFAAHTQVDVFGLLIWLFHDEVISALEREVDELADDAHALSDEDRAAHEAALQARLLEAERIEERLIEVAAEEGRAVSRRPNADPRAVLGLASALPGPLQ